MVRVSDALGNPVAGVRVDFAVAAGGGSVTDASQTTNSSGEAWADAVPIASVFTLGRGAA